MNSDGLKEFTLLDWVSGNKLCDDTVSCRGEWELVIKMGLIKTVVSFNHNLLEVRPWG